MTTQSTTTTKKSFVKRIKPLGWLFIAFFAVIAVSLVVLVMRPLTYPIRNLPTGAEAKSLAPTITPYVKPTNTVAPTITPLPNGWTQGQSLNGTAMLVPPEEEQEKIAQAFQSVWDCHFSDEASDAALKQVARAARCAQAKRVAADSLGLGHGNALEIITAGPLNPIQCTDATRCTLARAKLEVKGAVMDGAVCRQIKQSSPCVVRAGIQGLIPNQVYIATIVKENGTWIVTQWDTEQLPGPPPSR